MFDFVWVYGCGIGVGHFSPAYVVIVSHEKNQR